MLLNWVSKMVKSTSPIFEESGDMQKNMFRLLLVVALIMRDPNRQAQTSDSLSYGSDTETLVPPEWGPLEGDKTSCETLVYTHSCDEK